MKPVRTRWSGGWRRSAGARPGRSCTMAAACDPFRSRLRPAWRAGGPNARPAVPRQAAVGPKDRGCPSHISRWQSCSCVSETMPGQAGRSSGPLEGGRIRPRPSAAPVTARSRPAHERRKRKMPGKRRTTTCRVRGSSTPSADRKSASGCLVRSRVPPPRLMPVNDPPAWTQTLRISLTTMRSLLPDFPVRPLNCRPIS